MLAMFSNDLGKRFPELLGMPRNVQQDIVDQARYETFTQVKGSNEKFAWRFISLGVLGALLGGVIGYYSSSAIAGAFGGSGAVMAIYLEQKSWERQIHPKVRELAKRYIPPEE